MNITELKNVLNRKFRGANLDDVQGISDYSLFEEASRNLSAEINPQETIRRSTISVMGGVYDYSPPTDIKDLVDIRPQSNRNVTDNPTRKFSEDFDQNKTNNDFSLEYLDGSRLLRYSKDVGGTTEIHNCESVSGNGTWSAGGGGSNLAIDDNNPYQGGNSLRFDIGATGGYIENSTMTAIDLSEHENKSYLFSAVYIPDSSIIVSFNLLFGSSASAYFSASATAPQFGSFRTGWNLIPFNWNGATETGTVDTVNIDYLRLTVVSTSADTDLKADHFFSALPKVKDIHYYSNYLFKSTTGTWKSIPTEDSDTIVLDNDSFNIFIYECCRIISRELQRGDDYQRFTDELYGTNQKIGLYSRYKVRKPNEEIKPITRHRNISWNKK